MNIRFNLLHLKYSKYKMENEVNTTVPKFNNSNIGKVNTIQKKVKAIAVPLFLLQLSFA